MATMENPVVSGAALAPLSNRQKRELVLLARRAFAWQRKQKNLAENVEFEAWRHIQQWEADGKTHLTASGQGDYLAIKAHFLELLGCKQEAELLRLKRTMESRQWARWTLDRECAASSSPSGEFPAIFDNPAAARAYAAGFMRNKRGLTIEEATETDLLHAVFILRRKCQLERWKMRRENAGRNHLAPSMARGKREREERGQGAGGGVQEAGGGVQETGFRVQEAE